MDDLLKHIHYVSKNILKNEGSLSPVTFLIKDGGLLGPYILNYSNDDEKYANYWSIGLTAQKLNADRIILVNDIAMREAKNSEDAKYIRNNYDHESPLSYPESMRIDGILLVDIYTSTNKRLIYLQKFKKSLKDYVFLNLESYDQDSFDGALIQSVLKGLTHKE